MTHVHCKDDGKLVADPVVYASKVGIGRYDAAGGPIEAEWFSGLTGRARKGQSAAGGFEVKDIHDGNSLSFPNVLGLAGNTTVTFRVAAAAAGRIKVRSGSSAGRLLATCAVDGGGGWNTSRSVSAAFTSPGQTVNLHLMFRGGPGELIRFGWLQFAGPR